MDHLDFAKFDVISETEADRRMLAFEFDENQFNVFHAESKALPDSTQPTFKLLENNDVLVSFGNALTLNFAAAGEEIPANVAFILMGATRLNGEDSQPEIVLSLLVRPAA